MSEHLGPYAVEQGRQPMFLDTGQQSPKSCSEATARRIDDEAREMVERMYERARRLLDTRRDKLEALAQYLSRHEVVDQATLAMLLGDLRPNARPEMANS